MIERIARAIARAITSQDDYADAGAQACGEDMKVPYLDQGEVDFALVAKAALTTMREPTSAMEIAGYGNSKGDPDHTGCVDNPDPVEAYCAMIDAALAEEG